MFVTVKRFLLRSALVLGAIILLGFYPFSRLGAWLVVEDPLQHADAIVVLGGSMYERQLEAADLYAAGFAPRIYLLRERPDHGELELIKRGISYLRYIDLQVDALLKVGVPRQAIVILDPANSTADEADYVKTLVTREKFSRLIVVTSRQHTRRARLVMNRQLRDTGARVIMRATRYDLSDVNRWWSHRSTLRFTLFESQRLFAYWIGVAD